MHVYKKIRAYLDKNGLKQEVIAQQAGLPIATFQAMMCGQRTIYVDELIAICYALRVSPEVFIEINVIQQNKAVRKKYAKAKKASNA